MTAQSDPYVRVYYRIIDDPKFTTIVNDKAALGWWLTLLIDADAMYPASALVPRIDKRHLNKLVSAGLIDLLPGDRYRVHGLADERDQRSEHGRRAAKARYEQPVSNARAMHEQPVGTAHPLHSEPLLSEPNRTAPLRRGATGLTPIGNILRRATE